MLYPYHMSDSTMRLYFKEMDTWPVEKFDVTQSVLYNASGEISQCFHRRCVVDDFFSRMQNANSPNTALKLPTLVESSENGPYSFYLSINWTTGNNAEEFLCINLHLETNVEQNVTVGWKVSIIDCIDEQLGRIGNTKSTFNS